MTIFNVVVDVNAAAGAKGTIEALKVPPAQSFEVKRVMFIFPTGTQGNLGLALMNGILQLAPDKGLARGDGCNYSLFDDTVLGGSEKLEVYYQNDDTANDLKAWVIIEGEILR